MSTVQSPKAQVRVHIRWMIRRDMPEVLAIEHASFDFPWCEEEFLRVLRQRNCIGMVAEVGEQVVGFMIYELHKNKLHVLDFATPPRLPPPSGVGQQMRRQARRRSCRATAGRRSSCTSARPTWPPSTSTGPRASAPPRSPASTSETPARTPT